MIIIRFFDLTKYLFHQTNNLARSIPKIADRKDKKKFRDTFKIAFKYSPSINITKVSYVTEEKVVKLPQKPTATKSFQRGSNDNFFRKSIIKKESIKEPTTFTINVP